MIKIGITGIIGSGKSVVSSVFRILHIAVYNADYRAKVLMNQDPDIQNEIKSEFGEESYNDSGINTSYIASVIFNDESKRKIINSIVHPRVKQDFLDLSNQQSTEICAIESALIYEANFSDILDYIIKVDAPIDVLTKRIIKRDKISKEEAESRINSQSFNLDEKYKANFTINNDEQNSLIIQCMEIIKKIQTNG